MRDLPPGFSFVGEGRLRVIVRDDAAASVLPLLRQWASGALPFGRPLAGGRGGAAVFDLAPGWSVVLRPYRRGGLVSRFNRDLYFGVRPRAFRELRMTERLRALGVPTIEVLAAAVRWVGPGCCRAALVSREAFGAANLWEYLQSVPPAERARACAAAAAATRRLHAAGAVHPDLNLQNYLVRRTPSGPDVLIIDCDRIRFRPVSPRIRRAAFARICRSIRKLDPQSAVITLDCVEAFRTIEAPAE